LPQVLQVLVQLAWLSSLFWFSFLPVLHRQLLLARELFSQLLPLVLQLELPHPSSGCRRHPLIHLSHWRMMSPASQLQRWQLTPPD